MATVYLVDDHALLMDGLTHLLEHDGFFKICGQSASGCEALERIPAAKPDLVVLDIALPDKNGLSLIKDLQALCPDIPILVLSMHDEKLYAERVIRAGAKGYVMKEVAGEQLLKAMRKVLEGDIAVSSEAASEIFQSLTGHSEDRSHIRDLTDREFEVFELIGRGEDVHGIADQLGISPRTVDAHRAHIREKLNLPNSQALLRQAVRWVETGELAEEA